jgi:hypothetical protein
MTLLNLVESMGDKVTKSFKAIDDAAGAAGKTLDGAGQGLDKIGEALNKAAGYATKFGESGAGIAEAFAKIAGVTGETSQGIKSVAGAVGTFQDAAKGMRETLPELGKGLRGAVDAFKNLHNAASGTLVTRIGNVTQAVTALGAAFNKAFFYVQLAIEAWQALDPLFAKIADKLGKDFKIDPDLSGFKRLEIALAARRRIAAAPASRTSRSGWTRWACRGRRPVKILRRRWTRPRTASPPSATRPTRPRTSSTRSRPPPGVIDYDTTKPRTYGPDEDIPGVRRTYNLQHGGLLDGPGTTTSDSIPIRASRGEYVVNARAVDHYGVGFMHSLNAMRLAFGGLVPGFRKGGKPTDTPEIRKKQRELTVKYYEALDADSAAGQYRKLAREELRADASEAFKQKAVAEDNNKRKAYAEYDELKARLEDEIEALRGGGFASGGLIGAFASLARPIGLADGGPVGSAITERRFQSGGFAGAGGLSSVAPNLAGGGGLRNASHDVHLHLADGSSFKLQAETAVVGAMMRSASVQRMARIGRRSSSEG